MGAYIFVDEAGDPTLFDAKGRLLIGTPGCSKTFILGRIHVSEPYTLGLKLEQLRRDLLSDPYFKRVPSMQREGQKTALAFHAKDDVAEVRREVFRVLMALDFKFSAVVRHKGALLREVQLRNSSNSLYRYSPQELYDALVGELFRRDLAAAHALNISFAKRGNKARTHAFRAAMQRAQAWSGELVLLPSTPGQSAGLQVVDYCLWALQRYYERREERFIELIWDKVVEIEDLDGWLEGSNQCRRVLYKTNAPLPGLAHGAKQ